VISIAPAILPELMRVFPFVAFRAPLDRYASLVTFVYQKAYVLSTIHEQLESESFCTGCVDVTGSSSDVIGAVRKVVGEENYRGSEKARSASAKPAKSSSTPLGAFFLGAFLLLFTLASLIARHLSP